MRTGVSELARQTGYNQSYVSSMLKTGLSESEIRARARARGTGRTTRGSAAAGIGTPRRKEQPKENNRGNNLVAANRERAVRSAKGESMFDVRLRNEIAIADQREMELQIRRSEMVSRHMMREWISEGYVGAKDVLLMIAPELKDRLAVESDPVRVEQIIQGEIEVALRRIADLMRRVAEDAREAA